MLARGGHRLYALCRRYWARGDLGPPENKAGVTLTMGRAAPGWAGLEAPWGQS